jgi:hypothetical protein
MIYPRTSPRLRGGGAGSSVPSKDASSAALERLTTTAAEVSLEGLTPRQAAALAERLHTLGAEVERMAKEKDGKAADANAAGPPTTQEAIGAEIERVKALPSDQLDALGKKYTNAEELFLALESLTVLRASWVKTQRGGRLPKRGDPLPLEAIITVAELRTIAKASKCEYGALPVISLSHFWRTKEHPDPDGKTLELVISALEAHWSRFASKGVTDLGIVIDWCALFQAPRTPEQDIVFKSGLKGINQVSQL